MTLDERRREALGELQELLADGWVVAEAIAEVSKNSTISNEVLTKIGSLLIEQQPKLVSAKKISLDRADRKRRSDRVIELYRNALLTDPNAKSDIIESDVGITDFSADESSDLFLRTLDVWLDRNV